MRSLLLFAALSIVAAKPGTYKETEDFQYSRSSSDDGTKTGYYGAQRGNVGGNYEKAHNMDSLAQNQMSTAIKQVQGEVGDSSDAKAGSVYTAANTRGLYGRGHQDLSNLDGRNFEDDAHFRGSNSHATSNSGYGEHSLHSGGHSSFKSQSSSYSNRRLVGHSIHETNGNVNSPPQDNVHTYNNEQTLDGENYDSRRTSENSHAYNTKSRLTGAEPINIFVRPGSTVHIPVGSEAYNRHESNSMYELNSKDKITSQNQYGNYQPTGEKRYQSSYKYHKQWERQNASPGAVPLAVPTGETYPDDGISRFQNSAETYGSEYADLRSTSNSQHKYKNGYNSHIDTKTSRNSNLERDDFNAADVNNIGVNKDYSLSNPKRYESSYSYHKSWERQGDPYIINSGHKRENQASRSESTLSSGNHRSHGYGTKSSHSRYSESDCDEDDQVRVTRSTDIHQKPNHDSWGQETQDLGQQTQNQWENFKDLGQQSRSKWENLGQQTQNKWENLEDLRQQTQSQRENLKNLGRQTQSKWENLGQQTQNKWENLEDLGQQTQRENFKDLGQQTQSKWENLEDLGQRTQNQWEDRGQQIQNNWGKNDLIQQTGEHYRGSQIRYKRDTFKGKGDNLEQIGQQSHNTWPKFGQQIQDKWETYGQNTQDKWEKFGRQTQDKWQNYGQQTQDKWEKFGRQTQDKWEDYSKQTQNKWENFRYKRNSFENMDKSKENDWKNLEDMGQQVQNKWDNLDMGQQTQNKWDNLDDMGQQTQNKWENLEDMGQQTQNKWGNFQDMEQVTHNENLGQQIQNKWDNLEDMSQQTQNEWGNSQDMGQQTQHKWGSFVDKGQEETQRENKWDNLDILGQQTQNEWGKFDDLGQQTQNDWKKLEAMGQQTQNERNIGFQDQHTQKDDKSKETQSKWDTLENMGQQTQNKWDNLEDMGQHTQENLDNLRKPFQITEQNVREFSVYPGQQTQNEWSKPEEEGHTQKEIRNLQKPNQHDQSNEDIAPSQPINSVNHVQRRPTDLDQSEYTGQETQSNWDNLENLGQQTQNEWSQLDGIGEHRQNGRRNLGSRDQTQNERDMIQSNPNLNIEDLGQQSQSSWDDSKNDGQEIQNQWDKFKTLGQQSENTWDELGRNRQKTEFGQQSQNNWYSELDQQPQDHLIKQLDQLGTTNLQSNKDKNVETHNKNVNEGKNSMTDNFSQQTQNNWYLHEKNDELIKPVWEPNQEDAQTSLNNFPKYSSNSRQDKTTYNDNSGEMKENSHKHFTDQSLNNGFSSSATHPLQSLWDKIDNMEQDSTINVNADKNEKTNDDNTYNRYHKTKWEESYDKNLDTSQSTFTAHHLHQDKIDSTEEETILKPKPNQDSSVRRGDIGEEDTENENPKNTQDLVTKLIIESNEKPKKIKTPEEIESLSLKKDSQDENKEIINSQNDNLSVVGLNEQWLNEERKHNHANSMHMSSSTAHKNVASEVLSSGVNDDNLHNQKPKNREQLEIPEEVVSQENSNLDQQSQTGWSDSLENLGQQVQQTSWDQKDSSDLTQQTTNFDSLYSQRQDLNQHSDSSMQQQSQDFVQMQESFNNHNENLQQADHTKQFNNFGSFDRQSKDDFYQQQYHSVVDTPQERSQRVSADSQSKYNKEPIIPPEITTTEKPGFWKSVGNKFVSAKDSVSTWFSSG